MEYKKLNTIMLHTITKESQEEIKFYRELCQDKVINDFVHGLNGVLLSPLKFPFLGRGFLTSLNGELFGYIHIGDFNEEEKAVYLKAAIHSSKRGKGYGKLLLSEITDYIFLNYGEIEVIKLKIASENKASINTANACGYLCFGSDYYIKYNPYLNEEIKNSR